MVRGFQGTGLIATVGLIGAATLIFPSCGGTGHGSGMTGSGGGNGQGTGGNNGGTGGNTQPPPPPKCAGGVENAAATAIDFSNNVIAAPSPPRSLTPATAPHVGVVRV